jgi:hypothetical protein
MGESRRDRAGLLAQLARLDPHPESVPINLLVQAGARQGTNYSRRACTPGASSMFLGDRLPTTTNPAPATTEACPRGWTPAPPTGVLHLRAR